MKAEIITIGDEILIGQVVDTNSAWMGQNLNNAGIQVIQITSISDQAEAISTAVANALVRADVVLITGGLGPTRDDVTKQTLAQFFNMSMRSDPETLKHVEDIFKKFNRPLLDVNKKQAEVPDGCIVIKNQNGTAPCMWFDIDDKVVVSMPGVPFEMKYLMEEEIIPRIKSKFLLPYIYHKTLLTANIGESFLAEKLMTIEDQLPQNISLAYLPKLGQVRLRISGVGKDKLALEHQVNTIAESIIEAANDYIIADVDTTLDAVVLTELGKRSLTLSTAESCTGGYIGHMLTRNAGSSAVYTGGGITYTNALKQSILGVNPATLDKYGAVSEETVREMAIGALNKFKTDYALATTGIAGPGGEEPGKPVGTIWIGLANKENVWAKLFTFSSKREQNIERATMSAFTMLLNHLKNEAK